jgi:UDP-glucose 4-epimerase
MGQKKKILITWGLGYIGSHTTTVFIENASIVFMSAEEREKRYRLADKFVLQVMRYFPDIK